MTAASTAARSEPVTASQLRIVPANEASWADLQAIFGETDYPGRCYCQRYKTRTCHWSTLTLQERRDQLRAHTRCDEPDADTTAGLVAYLDGEPAGWVAVEPRINYPRLQALPTAWRTRPGEDKADEGVWSVTCFAVRRGYRKRGLTYPLAAATVGYARERGARALEAYPMITEPGKEITWGELHVGSRQVFEEAGFTEVSHPSKRRYVMRIDFAT